MVKLEVFKINNVELTIWGATKTFNAVIHGVVQGELIGTYSITWAHGKNCNKHLSLDTARDLSRSSNKFWDGFNSVREAKIIAVNRYKAYINKKNYTYVKELNENELY